jgi:L-threonylcarbamoyladenylate synthase
VPNSWHLKLATRALDRGGVIAYPTEAVWGLGCNPFDPVAVDRLLAMKSRPWQKGLILIASDMRQLEPFIEPISTSLRARIETDWPGPITWVLPAAKGCPHWVRGTHTTVAVRVTGHPLCRALCDQFDGALISTSANPAGVKAPRTALPVRRWFGNQLDYLLPGATGGDKRPSEIRDATSGATLRKG